MRIVLLKWFLVMLVMSASTIAHAAPKRYDLVSYQAPKRWTSDTSKGVLTLQILDPQKGTFGVIMVSPSSASAGSLDRDFQATWDGLIVPGFNVTAAPQLTLTDTDDGWQAKSGGATGVASGVPATIILVTTTGHGRTISAIITTNTDIYTADIEGFLTSIKMQKPAGTPLVAAPTTGTEPVQNSTAATNPATAVTTAATTTFDDGWTSTAEIDWVRVTRAGATVYLHHGVALDDASRQDVVGYFWSKLVLPRYAVSNVITHPYSGIDFPYYFVQAGATDRSTNAKGYVSLRVVMNNGVASCIEVFTPSSDAFQKLFPDQDKLGAIAGANRFAINKDIVGTWSSSSSASINMYYVATGGSAGVNAAALADKFQFLANKRFTSEHKGASGRIGSQQMFQQTYKGTYAMSAWELAVKRSDGTASVYAAFFEAVRGGWVLRMQDKKYSGSTFALVRAR